MGWFDRVERKLEGSWNGFFARAFKSEVQPVEISAAIRRAMDDRATLLGPGRTIVPNLYAIELSPTDFGRLAEYEQALSQELIAAAAEHADHNRYAPAGDFEVKFSRGQDLETGVFRVRPGSSARGQQGHHGHQGQQGQQVQPGPAQAAGHGMGGPGGYGAGSGQRSGSQGSGASVGQGPAYASGPGGPGPQGQPGQGRYGHGPYGPGQQGQGQNAQGDPGHGQGQYGPGYPQGTPQHGPRGAQGQHSGSRSRGPAPHIHPAARPWLEMSGDRYPLINALTTLGRDHDADIILDDPGISRHHSELRVTNDGPHLVTTIRDLGSTNGTFLNGDRISSEHLSDGDRITVGRITLVFHAGRR